MSDYVSVDHLKFLLDEVHNIEDCLLYTSDAADE